MIGSHKKTVQIEIGSPMHRGMIETVRKANERHTQPIWRHGKQPMNITDCKTMDRRWLRVELSSMY